MTLIRREEFTAAVADAFQYISAYHPPDFIRALAAAWRREESPSARDAIAQILTNSRMAAERRRPICQDTGIAVVFVKIGSEVRWDGPVDLQKLVDEGVRRAYADDANPLRASIVVEPAGSRSNSRDNTPSVLHVELVPGDRVEVIVAAKGGGSENKARFAVLNPSHSVADWVVETVSTLGAGWCPPGLLGIGVGGTPEKAMLLAKQALMAPIDIDDLLERGAANALEALRLEIYERVNRLGIGAQGLGGLTTVLDVKIRDWPTHAASLPVALIPNCAATRHMHFTLGDGPLPRFEPPSSDLWPQIDWQPSADARRIDLDALVDDPAARAQLQTLRPGETLLLSGRLLTGRDAAHRRIETLLASGEGLPEGVDFTNRFIYYVGPVDPVGDEAVGPAGPTTATRMDRYTEMMLAQTGLIGMIGKAERGPAAIEIIRAHRAIYLIAVGGAAVLVSQAIKKARVVAFPELGMEAIYEFEVRDMPVTVAVDSRGDSIHQQGPAEWRKRIEMRAQS